MDGSALEHALIREARIMNQRNLANLELTENKLELFRVLYPIFKNEIFQRREQMIRLAAFSCSFLVLLLVTLLAISPWTMANAPTRWLAISGVALFSCLFAYVILQHADRHRMAKQQLIALEQTQGLYEDGWQPNGDALFPNEWQSAWAADRSVTIYLSILTGLTALVICAILVEF